MQNVLLLPDEKIVDSRKSSMLIEQRFWIGIACFVFSAASFVLIDLFLPAALSVSGIVHFIGLPTSSMIFGSLPLVPVVFLVAGFLYVLYAELAVYFKEYIITSARVVIQHGIINKDSNILLPSKIEDVNVEITLVDRMLGLGRVTIVMQQDSRPPVLIAGIKDPYKFQAAILKLIGVEAPTTENGSAKDN